MLLLLISYGRKESQIVILKKRWEGIKGKEIGVCLFVYVYLGKICVNKIYHFSRLIMYTILQH